jgi:hypothetical protein
LLLLWSWCLPCNATLPYRTPAPENEDLVCVIQNKVMLSEDKNIRSFFQPLWSFLKKTLRTLTRY